MPSDDDEAARGLVERFPERVETPIRERCGVHAPEQAVVAMVEAALRDAREFERRLAACLALTVTKASAHAKLEAIAAAAGRSSVPGTAPLERPLYLKAVGLAGIPAPFSAEAGWMAFGLKDAADDEEEFVSRMREVWERGRREGLAEARR
jgi:hypothetical protein